MFVKTADRFVGIMLEHGIIDKSKEVVCRWGIMHMLDTIFNIAMFVLIGISADMLAETALYTASYIPLRIYAGGYHAATPRKCCIISLIMLVGSLLLISHAERMLIPFYALAVSAALILIVLMPISDIHKPLGKAERRKYRTKGIAVLLTEMFFSVSLFLLGQKRSSMVLASVWISLSLMLIFGAVINACKQERREHHEK